MFTLPVKPWQHIVSKLLVSILWIFLSFVVIMTSVLILVKIDNPLGEIARVCTAARGFFGDNITILVPVSTSILSTHFIITVYNALSIGHLFTNHRILASFGAFITIDIVSQIVFVTLYTILGGANFAVTNLILNKKLNLE